MSCLLPCCFSKSRDWTNKPAVCHELMYSTCTARLRVKRSRWLNELGWTYTVLIGIYMIGKVTYFYQRKKKQKARNYLWTVSIKYCCKTVKKNGSLLMPETKESVFKNRLKAVMPVLQCSQNKDKHSVPLNIISSQMHLPFSAALTQKPQE